VSCPLLLHDHLCHRQNEYAFFFFQMLSRVRAGSSPVFQPWKVRARSRCWDSRLGDQAGCRGRRSRRLSVRYIRGLPWASGFLIRAGAISWAFDLKERLDWRACPTESGLRPRNQSSNLAMHVLQRHGFAGRRSRRRGRAGATSASWSFSATSLRTDRVHIAQAQPLAQLLLVNQSLGEKAFPCR